MALQQEKTLAEMRDELAEIVGFAGQIKSGANKIRFNNYIKRAQRFLLMQHAGMFEDVEVFLRIATLQSWIDYPKAIDFRRAFQILINYTQDGQWVPLSEGVSWQHDSIYDEMPPRWQPGREYPIGHRIFPTPAALVYHEVQSIHAVVATPNDFTWGDTTSNGVAVGLSVAYNTDGLMRGTGMPLKTPEGYIRGVELSDISNACFVFASIDDFKEDDPFPWEKISVNDGANYRTFTKAQFGDAVVIFDGQYVWWQTTGGIYTFTPAVGEGDEAKIKVLSANTTAQVETGAEEPSWPTIANSATVEGDELHGEINWLSFDLDQQYASYGWPRKFERLHDSIRLWPFSQDAYEMKIVGKRAVTRLEEDADHASLDSDVIIMQAAVWAKAHYRHPDAEVWQAALDKAIDFYRGAAHRERILPRGKRRLSRGCTNIRPDGAGNGFDLIELP